MNYLIITIALIAAIITFRGSKIYRRMVGGTWYYVAEKNSPNCRGWSQTPPNPAGEYARYIEKY